MRLPFILHDWSMKSLEGLCTYLYRLHTQGKNPEETILFVPHDRVKTHVQRLLCKDTRFSKPLALPHITTIPHYIHTVLQVLLGGIYLDHRELTTAESLYIVQELLTTHEDLRCLSQDVFSTCDVPHAFMLGLVESLYACFRYGVRPHSSVVPYDNVHIQGVSALLELLYVQYVQYLEANKYTTSEYTCYKVTQALCSCWMKDTVKSTPVVDIEDFFARKTIIVYGFSTLYGVHEHFVRHVWENANTTILARIGTQYKHDALQVKSIWQWVERWGAQTVYDSEIAQKSTTIHPHTVQEAVQNATYEQQKCTVGTSKENTVVIHRAHNMHAILEHIMESQLLYEDKRIAIVPLKSQYLLPLLHTVACSTTNISIGYPLFATQIGDLCIQCLEIYKKNTITSYEDYIAVLENPLLHALKTEQGVSCSPCLRAFIRYLQRQVVVESSIVTIYRRFYKEHGQFEGAEYHGNGDTEEGGYTYGIDTQSDTEKSISQESVWAAENSTNTRVEYTYTRAENFFSQDVYDLVATILSSCFLLLQRVHSVRGIRRCARRLQWLYLALSNDERRVQERTSEFHAQQGQQTSVLNHLCDAALQVLFVSLARYCNNTMLEGKHLSKELVYEILFSCLTKERVSFTPVHDARVEIIGFHEIQALDFDVVYVFDVQESNIPRAPEERNLFPEKIASLLLGTPERAVRVAEEAHSFFALCNGADVVHLYYTPNTDVVGGSAVRSRFIEILLWEALQGKRHIQEHTITVPGQKRVDSVQEHAVIRMTDVLREKVLQRVLQGVHYSMLNKYSTCPYAFFHTYIFTIQEKSEQPSLNMLVGSAIHTALELFYAQYCGEYLSLLNVEEAAEDLVTKTIVALQNIAGGVIGRTTIAMLRTTLPNHFRRLVTRAKEENWLVLDVEKEYTTHITTPYGDIPLKGTIDALLQQEETTIILDYKIRANKMTKMRVQLEHSTSYDIFSSVRNYSEEHTAMIQTLPLQLMLYAHLVAQAHKTTDILPMFCVLNEEDIYQPIWEYDEHYATERARLIERICPEIVQYSITAMLSQQEVKPTPNAWCSSCSCKLYCGAVK